MEAPHHLQHKPIIVVDNYDKRDGKYAKSTDAKALSLGFSQWDEDDLSVKIWRHSGKKWSRQSEELPIHRALDLSILTFASFIAEKDTHYSKTSLGETIRHEEHIENIKRYFINNEKTLLPRIEELKRMIDLFLIKNKK